MNGELPLQCTDKRYPDRGVEGKATFSSFLNGRKSDDVGMVAVGLYLELKTQVALL